MKFDIYVIQIKLEKFYLDAIKEYEKRLTRYGKTQLHMLKNCEQLFAKLTGNSLTVLVTANEQTISCRKLRMISLSVVTSKIFLQTLGFLQT